MYFRDDFGSYAGGGTARLAHEARRFADRARHTSDEAAPDPLAEVNERLGAVETAVVILAAGDDDDAGGARNARTGERTDDDGPDQDFHPETEQSRVASSMKFQNKRNDGPNVRVSDVQAANERMWPRDSGESVTGGSQSLAASSRKAETDPAYMPNAAGSIDVPRRASTTQATLNRGQTWGVNDAALATGAMYRRQMQRTNRDIAAIGAKWAGRR